MELTVYWLVILVLLPSVLVNGQFYTVLYDSTTTTYTLEQGLDIANGVSWGQFDGSAMNTTGWTSALIVSSSNYPAEIQSTAAGYLEGAITHTLIYEYQEMFNTLYPNSSSLNLQIIAWFQTHISWIEAKVQNYTNERKIGGTADPFWDSVGLMMAQLRGLVAGYNKYAPAGQGLSFTQLFMLNSGGDLMDVMMSLDPSTRSELFLDHCSALILPVFNKTSLVDIFTAHTTWDQYNSMLRIFKQYLFNYDAPADQIVQLLKSKSLKLNELPPTAFFQSFSSYPGFLFSGDDYYTLSTGLAVIETTFTIFNDQLYAYVKPDNCVLTWMRAAIANRLATTGEEWAMTFERYNSGTYNNQWMVVDYKLLSDSLQDGTLWVIEQIPGTVFRMDATQILQTQGYWASYNIPFSQPIYQFSGYAEMAQQYGAQYVYNASARANIFRRDAPKVTSLSDMQALMQYNDWQNDPLSLGNPSYSISSRFDLLPGNNSQLMGGTDSKITSANLFAMGSSLAISGPTHQQQKPFSWVPWGDSPHFGQPEVYDFDWVLF